MAIGLRILTPSLFALIALTAAADEKGTAAFDDATFLKKAASGGMHEVQLGKLAKARAQHSDVKKFAGQMVTDHGKANKELAAVAKQVGVSLPKKQMKEHQKEYDRFNKMKKGANFDAAYMKHMVEDHEHDVAEFTKASKSAKDERVRKLAAKLLPTLKEHLTMARDTQKKVGGGAR